MSLLPILMKNKDFESIASAAPGLNRAVRFAFTTENWLICCDMGTTLCWQCTHEKHEYENMLFRFLFGSKRGEIGLIPDLDLLYQEGQHQQRQSSHLSTDASGDDSTLRL